LCWSNCLKKKKTGVHSIVSGGDKIGDHQVSDRPQVKRVPVQSDAEKSQNAADLGPIGCRKQLMPSETKVLTNAVFGGGEARLQKK